MLRRLLLFSIVCAAASCSLSKQNAPPLAGPSEFGLSLAVTASPDVVSQDGQSQSMVSVTARDANGQPIRGVTLRLGMFVGDTSVDYGTLASKTISTDSGGFASTLYTAPVAPPPTVSSDTIVTIQVVPTGTDYGNTEPRYVYIRLTRPGVILPPNPGVVPKFSFSPLQPQEDQVVQFDASASTGANLTYAWTFGDGSTGSGIRPTHRYSVAGTYSVVLTVTDDRGTAAMSAPTPVQVAAAADPTAAFTISPTDPSVGDTVYVDGSSSTTPIGSDRTIVTYEWNFGDGATGSGKTASHVYGKAGTYTIVLNVKDSTGRRGTTSKTLQVK